MTIPKRAFCTITRKEIARSAKTLGTPRVCWHANARRFSKSFGGRLAQIRAIRARNSERRAWSSAEEFDQGGCAHTGPEDKCAPSSRAVFARGERAGGEGLDGLRKSFSKMSSYFNGVYRLIETKEEHETRKTFWMREFFSRRTGEG